MFRSMKDRRRFVSVNIPEPGQNKQDNESETPSQNSFHGTVICDKIFH